MNRLACSLAPLLAVLASSAARAEDARLPFNPFARATPGDWSILLVEEKRGARWSRIVSVENDTVTLDVKERDVKERDAKVASRTRTFSTKTAPTLADYFGLEDATVADVAIEKEERSLCGSTHPCQKVSFTLKRGAAESRHVAWFAPEVRAGGLVAWQTASDAKELACAGSGTAEGVERGADADSVLDAEMLPAVFAKITDPEWPKLLDKLLPGGSETPITKERIQEVAEARG
ncbi:MAG: hypothetical protein ACAI25_03065, partial [Planctomycetota bacterium]